MGVFHVFLNGANGTKLHLVSQFKNLDKLASRWKIFARTTSPQVQAVLE